MIIMIIEYSFKKSLTINFFYIINTATVFRQKKSKIEPRYKKSLKIVQFLNYYNDFYFILLKKSCNTFN